MKAGMWIAAVAAGVLLLVGAALSLGGPGTPNTKDSISQAFSHADYSTVPPPHWFVARDGTSLAYRMYAGNRERGSVVLVHGSSATSQSMHPLAMGLATAGYTVYALDIRGHGDSGRKGHIAYVGQLEDDFVDFLKAAGPRPPLTLAGFSSGGGFVLRIAALQSIPAIHSVLLLSPFLHQDAPTQKPESGGWASVGVPRIIALHLLNGLGFRGLNHLPVVRFAVAPANRDLLTDSYDFNLEQNFRPREDYRADIAGARRPMIVLVGDRDEAFWADRFEATFSPAPGMRGVQIVPGMDHASIVLDTRAIELARAVVEKLQAEMAKP